MKPRFIYALAVIVAAIGMTSCQGGGGSGKLKELEFKRMHLDGVNALALASVSSDTQNAPRRAPAAEGDTVYDMRPHLFRFGRWYFSRSLIHHQLSWQWRDYRDGSGSHALGDGVYLSDWR